MERHLRREISRAVRQREILSLKKLVERIRTLPKWLASMNDGAEGEKTALMIAAEMGWTEGVRLLLSACDARKATSHGETALSLATLSKHADAECVRALARAGDPRAVFQRLTPLQWAAKRGRVDKVSALMPLSDVQALVGGSESLARGWRSPGEEIDALSLAIQGDHLSVVLALAPRSDKKSWAEGPSRAMEAARGLAPNCLSFFLKEPAWQGGEAESCAQILLREACGGWHEGLGIHQPKKSLRQERAVAILAQEAIEQAAVVDDVFSLARRWEKKGFEQTLARALANIEAKNIARAMENAGGETENPSHGAAMEASAPRSARMRL